MYSGSNDVGDFNDSDENDDKSDDDVMARLVFILLKVCHGTTKKIRT